MFQFGKEKNPQKLKQIILTWPFSRHRCFRPIIMNREKTEGKSRKSSFKKVFTLLWNAIMSKTEYCQSCHLLQAIFAQDKREICQHSLYLHNRVWSSAFNMINYSWCFWFFNELYFQNISPILYTWQWYTVRSCTSGIPDHKCKH